MLVLSAVSGFCALTRLEGVQLQQSYEHPSGLQGWHAIFLSTCSTSSPSLGLPSAPGASLYCAPGIAIWTPSGNPCLHFSSPVAHCPSEPNGLRAPSSAAAHPMHGRTTNSSKSSGLDI